MFCIITARDNKKVKQAAFLVSSAKQRKKLNMFVLEGTRLCSEAVNNNILIDTCFYTKSVFDSHKHLIQELSARAGSADLVSEQVFLKMSDTESPQGILLTASFKKAPVFPISGRILIFERISDPSNLGAAARTAEALGFSGILLSRSGVDAYSPKSLRASMGALLRIPVHVSDNIINDISELRTKGFVINGMVVDKTAQKIQDISFCKNEGLLIGNEAAGLTDEIKSVCDRLVTIPMSGRAESLNAAAAASIAMWELSR